MARERLDKILTSQNIGSRKETGEMIRRGRVGVNGIPVLRPEEKIDPDQAEITVDGRALDFRRYAYIMMNKPKGVLSAARDSRMQTVVDLLPPELFRRGLFPAGRLDRDTQGLLIITDDGEFAHRMLAPKNHVYKTYRALLDRPAVEADVEAFAKGVILRDMVCLPASLKILDDTGKKVQVKVREGKFHQVKRMFLACGKTVQELERVQIGRLCLDFSLEPGAARLMTEEEKRKVFAEGILY